MGLRFCIANKLPGVLLLLLLVPDPLLSSKVIQQSICFYKSQENWVCGLSFQCIIDFWKDTIYSRLFLNHFIRKFTAVRKHGLTQMQIWLCHSHAGNLLRLPTTYLIRTLILEGRGNAHGALALGDVSSVVSWCPNLACSSSCIWPSRLCILDVYLYISNVPQKCLQEKGSCSSTSDFSIVPYMYQILPKCTTFEMLYRVV